jgi:cytochrome c5
MRRFLAGFALLVLIVVSVAGFRGALSRRPPIELFSDMDRQPKVRPQTRDSFFADGLASRRPVPGTVARDDRFADTPENSGRVPGTTNFVATLPVPVTAGLLARGQERFTIYCAPCHGGQGNGRGVVPKLGLVVIANLHEPRIVAMPDGQLFQTITAGRNLMPAYGAEIRIPDRWAIVAYVRALQISQLATLEEVPAAWRTNLFSPQP